MSFSRQMRRRLVSAFAVGQIAVLPLAAQTNANRPPSEPPSPVLATLMPPPMPQAPSPVDFFRKLLAMTPAQREDSLTNRPLQIRVRILAKVREYEALNPEDRELRLRATELRWYLLPLLHATPPDRTARLAEVPDSLRNLVQSRLDEWNLLPPQLQQEFLDNERAMRYFTHVGGPPMPGESLPRTLPDADAARWNALSEDQRKQIAGQFNHFFELPPQEKQRTLGALSEAERQEMGKTLQAFSQLPPEQRRECVHAFTEFASMSAPEKREFLKNAERWSQLSPKERQVWRDLVAHVPPLPPMPPAPEPPMPALPSVTAPHPHPAVATNHN